MWSALKNYLGLIFQKMVEEFEEFYYKVNNLYTALDIHSRLHNTVNKSIIEKKVSDLHIPHQK